jgi:zinc protease
MAYRSFDLRHRLALCVGTAALVATLATPVAAATPKPALSAWGVPLTDVVADPAVRYGRLANGMRYAIQRNQTPKGTAAVRLNFQFGSIGERNDERGLAHFIEHMAFNGTTNVPEGEMVKILERQGLAFGPDTNAQTGFDTTTYMLDLPATDAQHVDTALFLMREVASEVKFDPASLDRERGVIEGERRARDSFQLRYITDLLNFQSPETLYGKRLPIGTTEVIKGTTAQRIAALYHRYYRPENATLVIVGDVDPAAIEAQVKARFGSWKGVGPAGAALPRGRIDLQRPISFSSFVDPAMTNTATLATYRPWSDPTDTVGEWRNRLVRNLAALMFNRRLERLTSAPGSVLLGGAMSTDDLKEAALTTSVAVYAKDGEWNSALSTAEQEVRRAVAHGFTASELKQALAILNTSYETAAAQADTRKNNALADTLVASVASRDFVTAPAWRLAQYKALIPTLTVDRVNAEFRNLWAGSDPIVFVSAKQPVGSAQQLAAAFAKSSAAPTPARADTGLTAFAYDSFGKPGTIVSDTVIAAAGVRTITFANNVRLNLKRTDFEQGKVRFEVRMLGGQLALPADKPGLNLLMSVSSALGGTGKHSLDEMKQLLAGKVVSFGTAVIDDAFVAAGTTTAADLGAQLKVSAAYLLDPGYRAEAASQWANIVPLIHTQAQSQPQGVAGLILPGVLANDDQRFGLPTTEKLLARSFDEVRAAYAPIAASAPIEIGIVGDVDEAAAIAAVAASFGAVAKRSAAPPDYATARVASFRKNLSPVTLTHQGQPSQAMVVASWPTDDDRDPLRAASVELLGSALKVMLTDKVREELGASYGASVDSAMSDSYTGFGVLSAQAIVAPDKVDEVELAIAAAAERLRLAPVDADLLARARNPLLERADKNLRENGYWLDRVTKAQSDPTRIDRALALRQMLAAITPADLQALAKRYLTPQHLLKVRIVRAATPVMVAAPAAAALAVK